MYALVNLAIRRQRSDRWNHGTGRSERFLRQRRRIPQTVRTVTQPKMTARLEAVDICIVRTF
jgi:hypothetical protein